MNEKDTGQMLRQMFEYGKFGNGRIYENSLMGLIMTLNYWVGVGLDYRKLHMRISEADKIDKRYQWKRKMWIACGSGKRVCCPCFFVGKSTKKM